MLFKVIQQSQTISNNLVEVKTFFERLCLLMNQSKDRQFRLQKRDGDTLESIVKDLRLRRPFCE